jgi:2-methylisocitrate lyase-like PEP mutase family enzyme
MSPARRLRHALAQSTLIVAPGAYDCISARLIEQAGYPAVYMSGGCSAMMLGYPDYGLVTMSEMADNAGRIAGAVSVPVIADADTGYGNELNVTRTVREYESRGVAAIQIEDQTFPKRCGHLAGKQVIAAADFAKKIAAAVAARRDPDTLIVARTDARAAHGLDESVDRMNAAFDAGADVAFVEALQSGEEIERVPKLVRGPCLLNFVVGGNTPPLDLASVEGMGYRIAIAPALMLMATIGACDAALAQLRSTRRHPPPPAGLTIAGMMNRLGGDAWNEISTRYER